MSRLHDHGGRGITYTTYGKQAEALITHFQVAEAAMKIDEAEFHAYRAADLVDAKAASREAWTLEERARVRMDAGMTVRLASIECRVVTEVTGGTHSVFLAEVHSAQATNGMPLTYFRGRMGHFAFMNTETEASLWKAMRWEDAI